MTTIAYSEKLGTISCDTLCIHQNVKFFCETKFYDGERFLLAAAGNAGELWRVANLIEKILEENKGFGSLEYTINSKIDWKNQNLENSYILFDADFVKTFDVDGSAYVYSGGNFFPMVEKNKALGSGLEFATSFMALKPEATTKEAVEFASQFDVYTGGEVKTFDLINWRYV
jgi:ATP-dependent protease HslVU (ClpYQ) peptidase subunit